MVNVGAPGAHRDSVEVPPPRILPAQSRQLAANEHFTVRTHSPSPLGRVHAEEPPQERTHRRGRAQSLRLLAGRSARRSTGQVVPRGLLHYGTGLRPRRVRRMHRRCELGGVLRARQEPGPDDTFD